MDRGQRRGIQPDVQDAGVGVRHEQVYVFGEERRDDGVGQGVCGGEMCSLLVPPFPTYFKKNENKRICIKQLLA